MITTNSIKQGATKRPSRSSYRENQFQWDIWNSPGSSEGRRVSEFSLIHFFSWSLSTAIPVDHSKAIWHASAGAFLPGLWAKGKLYICLPSSRRD